MTVSFDFIRSKDYITQPIVSIITPVSNNEKTIKHTIESVLQQSIMPQIEYILIDDGSRDQSREILKAMVKEHSNLKVIFLKKSTGTPAYPRNLGIILSNAPYLTFLDPDDWLESTGLEKLYTILQETGDDYAIGRTIKVTSNEMVITAEHESFKERRSIAPTSIPHIFNHLAPRARMIKSSIIKDNIIQFPEMKYAQEKQFFLEVLTKCKRLSTTDAVIYYLNRRNDNRNSLAKQINPLIKMNCNKKVIQYFHQQELDPTLRKMIFNRLYEVDSFNGFMNKYYTIRSDNHSSIQEKLKDSLKRWTYNSALRKILKTTSKLDYSLTEQFLDSHNKICYALFQQKRYQELEAFLKWYNKENGKSYVRSKDSIYTVSPLPQPNKYIKIPMYAEVVNCDFAAGVFRLDLRITGDYENQVENILFHDRNNIFNQVTYSLSDSPVPLRRVTIPEGFISPLSKSTYNLYLVFNEYQKIPLQIPNKKLLLKKSQTENHHFYKNVHNQLALKVL